MTAGLISHYRLLQPIGAGGMGEVYAGFDETLKRKVALKSVNPAHRLSAQAKARFTREAQILSQLDHPNICRVYDYIEDVESDWLVMELIEGKTLRDAQAVLDFASKLRVAEQIAAVLVVTHGAGVVHRDLKPGNVMLTARGEVKVLDFGLARSIDTVSAPSGQRLMTPDVAPQQLDAADDEVTRSVHATPRSPLPDVTAMHTQDGAILGTLAYMSPEQAGGDAATSASDMYAFGLLLQELFTGRPPDDGELDYFRRLEKRRRGETPPPVGLAKDLTTLIVRLKSAAPAQRPTAVDAAERLRWIRDTPKRRLRWSVAAAALLAVAIAGTKYTIDLRRERTAAVAARQDADRRRQQAETLIGFMLDDLRPKLQQVGRLALLEDVGSEATKYFDAVPPSDLSGEELFRRSQALHQIGEIKQAEGKLPDAANAYRASVTYAEQAFARDPNNSEWQLGLGTAHFYVGDASRVQGDLPAAMREFTAYRDVAQRLVDHEPQNEKWLLELSYGFTNVGAVLEAQGSLPAAKQQFEDALRITSDLARRKPADVERQQALALEHNHLGVVLDKLGDAAAALTHYDADLVIRRQFVASNPTNLALRRSLQVALSAAGRAYEDSGQIQPAIELYGQWRDVTAASATADPRNSDWQRDAAVAKSYLAGALRFVGRLDEAESELRKGLAALRQIVAASPTVALWQRDLAAAELNLGQIGFDRGDLEVAARQAQVVEHGLASLVGSDRVARLRTAEAQLLGADVAERRGNISSARAQRDSALSLVTSNDGSMETRALAVRARALLALHKVDDARPFIATLERRGYRHPALMKDVREKGH
jgi:tetratricopeptide (TPR) repeat protein/predicted Ser/Thr protein kinase